MKRMLIVLLLCSGSTMQAQLPILEIIRQGIKQVIVAVDLKVQRLQNKVILLQQAQKELENEQSQQQLSAISDWVEKQRKLYADYFEELRQVKSAISQFQAVKDIVQGQARLVSEIKSARTMFRSDPHFTPEELLYMGEVFAGMLEASAKNLDQLFLVIKAYATQMTDAQRLQIIAQVARETEQTLTDLRQFNEENKMLSLQRVTERTEIDYLRKLYGINR